MGPSETKETLARGVLPRRRAGVAPAGASWGVSCSGTSNFLLLSKESYQRKPLETTFQDFLGAGRASAKLAVLISRNWCGGGRCRFGGSLVPLAPLPLTAVRVGVGALVVFGDYQIAPIAVQSTAMGRCARWAQDIIACDTAERIIFAVVAGSGSGKLCWHSRGNDNDQENAGYVRENGQRRTGVAR